MNLFFAAMMLMVQDGLSYDGPSLDQLSPEAYATYFDRNMSGYGISIDYDDGTDGKIMSVKTEKCVSRITGPQQLESGAYSGPEKTWVIDWTNVKLVGQDVPYFFAVIDQDDKIMAFMTNVSDRPKGRAEADMLSLSTAYGAALYLHLTCDSAAKARYEELAKPPAR